MIDAQHVLSEYLKNPIRMIEVNINIPTFSVFFDPRNEFVDWMKKFCGDKTVIDCGCGLGHTVAVLRHAGIKAEGVDLCKATTSLIQDIHIANAACFHFTPNHVAIMTRPCRGDWIHATIIKAVESGVDFVYVGKEEHYETDLALLPYNVQKVLTNAGIQNESVWLISKEAPKC